MGASAGGVGDGALGRGQTSLRARALAGVAAKRQAVKAAAVWTPATGPAGAAEVAVLEAACRRQYLTLLSSPPVVARVTRLLLNERLLPPVKFASLVTELGKVFLPSRPSEAGPRQAVQVNINIPEG